MSNVEPNNAPPLSPDQRPTRTSKIPLSYAAEVLHRREELGWTLRDLSGWLSDTLGDDISHRAVDRFIRRQQRLTALEAQRSFQEILLQELDGLREGLSEERRLLDDTEEDIARARRKAPERVKELEADHARGLRKIRSLVAQFNAYGKHVPKPDSRVVPVCTPSPARFTPPESAPTREVAAPVVPAPAKASPPKSDSPAVPVCTPDLKGSTAPKAEQPRHLPRAIVISSNALAKFSDWLASRPKALQGRPLDLDPAWVSDQTEVFFFDLSQERASLKLTRETLAAHPEYAPHAVFIVPEDAPPELLLALPCGMNPPLFLPLTKEKVNAALQSVARSTQTSKPPLRKTG